MNNEGTLGAVVGAAIAIGAVLLWSAIAGRGTSSGEPQVAVSTVESPTLCVDAAGSKPGVRVLKVGVRKDPGGNDEAFVLPDPEEKSCALQNEDVITWIADTDIAAMTVHFVADKGTPCATAQPGSSPNPSAGDKLPAPTLNGVVAPRSITIDTSKTGDFYYCVEVKPAGSTTPVWTPNPAIIIKPS